MEVIQPESMTAKEAHAKDFIPMPAKPGALLTPGSVSNGNKFVKAIDQKARSYLKTLERSFSSSMDERLEDPASMTIEFLRARLQIQRTEYKLEKERAQQLERKVLELEERLNSEIQQRKKAECNNTSPSRSGDDRGPLTPLHCNEELSSEAMAKIDPQIRNNTHYSSPLRNACVEATGDNGSLACPSCYRLLSERLESCSEQMLWHNPGDQDSVREILPKQDICYGRCLQESVPTESRDMTYRDEKHDENILYQKYQKLNMKLNSIERKNSLEYDYVKTSNKARNHYRETGAENHIVDFHHLEVKPLNRIKNNEVETFVKSISLEHKPCCNQGHETMVGNIYQKCPGNLTQSPSRNIRDQARVYYSDIQDDCKQYAETRKVSFNLSPTRFYNVEMHPQLCNSNLTSQGNKKKINQMCDPEGKAVKAEMIQYVNSSGRVGGLNWVKSQEFYASLDDVSHNPVASVDMQTGHYPVASVDIKRGHTLRAQGRRMSLDGGLERFKHVFKALDAAK